MITPKIEALFQFIEYLHSNIEKFNQYNQLISEIKLLDEERCKLKPKENFNDKLKHDEVQAEIKRKNQIVQENTASLITAKAIELHLCNFENGQLYGFNGLENDIHVLKGNFRTEDLTQIFKSRKQYIEYRTKTHKTFLSLEFFFGELDEVLKGLFDYFKETEHSEFEAFKTEEIQVDSIEEALLGFSQGHTKFKIPTLFYMETSASQKPNKQNVTVTYFQAIDIFYDEIQKAYKNVDIIVDSQNDTLINQRLNKLEKEIVDFDNFMNVNDSITILRDELLEIDVSKQGIVLQRVSINGKKLIEKLSTNKIYTRALDLFQKHFNSWTTIVQGLKSDELLRHLILDGNPTEKPEQNIRQKVEESSKDITTGYLATLNIDKYVNWTLGRKSITRGEKKESAMSLMRGREKNISNYRFVIDEVFVKTKYWKQPTLQDIENFPFWREEALKREQDFYNFKLEGNPLPLEEIKKECGEKIASYLEKFHMPVIDCILTTYLTEDYYGLATVAGKIDFLKELHTDELDNNKKDKANDVKDHQQSAKPILNNVTTASVCDILTNFFSESDLTKLKEILQSGENPGTKLLFKSTGNRLSDLFGKLIKHDFITGWQQKDLINWIVNSFNYLKDGQSSSYTFSTVEKTVSKNSTPCKAPLIEIINKEIKRVDTPKQKTIAKK